MSQQTQIEVEAAAGKLLRQMAQFGSCPCEKITPAVRWLLDRQYAYRANGQLYITEPNPRARTAAVTGRDYYNGLCRNPSSTKSPRAWMDKARSGLTVKRGRLGMVSARSNIDRAAIPGSGTPHTSKTPEDIMNDNEQMIAGRKKLLAELEITEGELQQFMDEHRIRHCAGCKSMGIFDRRGRNGLQHLCRKCRKKRRGK